MEFIAVMVPEGGGGFSVLFPDLPGCVTQGETVAEAIGMAADALAGHVATLEAHGDPVPAGRDVQVIRADRAWAAAHGVKWETAIIRHVEVTP